MEGIGDVWRGLAATFPRSPQFPVIGNVSGSRREALRVLGKLRLLESWSRDPSRRNFLLKCLVVK